MSTKIYNAYRFKKLTAEEMVSLATKLRKKLKPVLIEKVRSLVLINACKELDVRSKNQEYAKQQTASPFRKAIKDLEERTKRIKDTKERDPEVDFNFEISFFPTKKNGTLAMIFTEQKAFKDTFKKVREVQDFEYWDNADPLEGISRSDWKKRGRIWDQALNDTTASKSGLSIIIFDGYFDTLREVLFPQLSDFEPFMKSIPSFEERLRDEASDLVFFERAKGVDVNESWRLFLDHKSYIETAEGSKALLHHKEQLSKKLIKKVTLDLLRKEKPE